MHLTQWLGYKTWANEVFYGALSTAPPECLTAPQPIYFGNMQRTLHHVYAMDSVWRAHLLGESHQYTSRNPPQCPPFALLRRMQNEIDRWYCNYFDNLSSGDLDGRIDFEFIGGGAGSMTRCEILWHVVNHGTYHRGHVAEMLYHAGVFPPATDFPVYLREMRAPINDRASNCR